MNESSWICLPYRGCSLPLDAMAWVIKCPAQEPSYVSKLLWEANNNPLVYHSSRYAYKTQLPSCPDSASVSKIPSNCPGYRHWLCTKTASGSFLRQNAHLSVISMLLTPRFTRGHQCNAFLQLDGTLSNGFIQMTESCITCTRRLRQVMRERNQGSFLPDLASDCHDTHGTCSHLRFWAMQGFQVVCT